MCDFASSGLTKQQKIGFHTVFTLFSQRLNSSSNALLFQCTVLWTVHRQHHITMVQRWCFS